MIRPRTPIVEFAGTFVLIACGLAVLVSAAVALPGIALAACERPRCTPIAPAAFWLLVIVLPAAVAAVPCTIAVHAQAARFRTSMIAGSVVAVLAAVAVPVVVVASYV